MASTITVTITVTNLGTDIGPLNPNDPATVSTLVSQVANNIQLKGLPVTGDAFVGNLDEQDISTTYTIAST